MNESNVCEHCNLLRDLRARVCSECRQPLVVPSTGAITIWRLGDIEDGVLGPILRGVRRTFGREVVLQPAYLDERPSARRSPWKGISANVVLEQVARRHRRGTFLSLGVTEENIVPGAGWNFVFGL